MGASGVVKNYVFPALRLLVWAVIALALLWIAFGRGGGEDAPGGGVGTSAVVEAPPAQVVRGDVVNTVTLQGSVVEDPAATVRSTAAGDVGRVRAAVGDAVEKGDVLFTVVVTLEDTTAPAAGTDPAAAPAAPRTKTVSVTSPATGTLTGLDVLAQQAVTVGQDVATVSPGTLSVTAPLTQEQQFRLLEPPSAASVTVPGGPGRFECTDLRTGRPAGASTPSPDPAAGGYVDPYADPSQATTGAEVSCRVPEGLQVFAGLTATVDVTAGQATGVLLVPVTAVEGRVGDGKVWVLDPATGEQTETPVRLGLTDGSNVEVLSGVDEGTQVLQFVPGSDQVSDPYAAGGSSGVVYG